jgi:hypothetical protein
MKISWRIQKTKNKTRSKALEQAWAIFFNEDIAVQYLTRKMNNNVPLSKKVEGQFSLFTH